MVAADEAHCISESDDRFRSEYRGLGALRQCVPGVPFLALTATAAPHVRQDIMEVLQLARPLLALESIYRPHLYLARELKPSTLGHVCRRVLELLTQYGTPAIVYVTKPKDAERLLAELRRKLADTPLVLETYHGPGRSGKVRQSDEERTRVLSDFMAELVSVMVATCAFGLGINKRGIKQIIHVGLPHNFLDGYVQEIGRGGRGGVPARCTLLASSADVAVLDRGAVPASRHTGTRHADRMRDFLFGDGCRWAFLREAFGELTPWMSADGSERHWEWKQSGSGGERRCHHCDRCCAATDADSGAGSQSVECSALVRVLLSALREAQNDEAAGGASSWQAISQKLQATGSKLQDLRTAVSPHLLACGPRSRSRASFQLRAWLSEVLAARTKLVERITKGGEREGNRPYDGFVLTAAGAARLRLFDETDDAGDAEPLRPLTLTLPKELLRSLCMPAEGADLRSDDEDSDREETDAEEEDETRLVHEGYAGAMLPRPAVGVTPRKGDTIAVFYAPPYGKWYDGVVVKCEENGQTRVRFADGEFPERLARKRYGRFAMWVLRDPTREEEWRASGHQLIGQRCDVHGCHAEVRMWCERRGLFATCSLDEEQEADLTLEETEEAVLAYHRHQQRSTPYADAHRPAETRGSPIGAPSDELEQEVGLRSHAATDAAVPPADSHSHSARHLPWALAWELERTRQRDAWQPSATALAAVRTDWERIDADAAKADEASSAVPALSTDVDEARLARHRARLSAVRRELAHAIVLPYAPRGFVLKYRVRVRTGGSIELLEARKDGRTLAHALFGEEAWLHVEFDELPEGKAERERERRAQQRLLAEGVVVCGRRFLCFGDSQRLRSTPNVASQSSLASSLVSPCIPASATESHLILSCLIHRLRHCRHRARVTARVNTGAKEGRSLDDFKAYFIAERGEVQRAERSLFEGPPPSSWQYEGVRAARNFIAAFHSMPSVAKLHKRLCLPFSGTQRALHGSTARVFDRRSTAAASVPSSAPRRTSPYLPLQLGSPLLSVQGGGSHVHVYLVDDVPATYTAPDGTCQPVLDAQGKPRIMTDGCGLIAQNLAALLPPVCDGLKDLCGGGGPCSLASDLAALGYQMRLYVHGYVAKGMLMTSHSLPPNVIVLTASQVKVEPPVRSPLTAQHQLDATANARSTDSSAAALGLFALELIDETRWHRPRLNSQLIPILEGAAGPRGSEGRRRLRGIIESRAALEAEQLLRLQQPSLSREQQLAASLRLAHAKASASRPAHFGLGTPSVADMIDAGVEVLREPFLLEQCQRGVDGALTRIRKGKLLAGDASVVVKGFPDFSGTLAEGEIMLIVDGKHYQPLALRGMPVPSGGVRLDSADGEAEAVGASGGAPPATPALVYRPPGVRAGDVRLARSVYSEALAAELFGHNGMGVDPSRASAVFFSIRGAQPLGDMLAGGDYDGDSYYILQERDLIELFRGQRAEASSSGSDTSGASSSGGAASGGNTISGSSGGDCVSASALESALHAHFLTLRHDTSVAVGTAEVNHAAAVDRLGITHHVTVELGEMYLDLLDGRGNPHRQAERLKALRSQIGARPQWMQLHRDGPTSWYTASSECVLAMLAQFMPPGGHRLSLHASRLRVDPLLRLDRHLSSHLNDSDLQVMRAKWQRKYKEYRARLSKLKKRQEDEERMRARGAGGGSQDSVDAHSRGSTAGFASSKEHDHEAEWRDRYYELVAQMREHDLLAPYEDERRASPLVEPLSLLAEACALYEVVYNEAEHATRGQADPKYYTAFAWHMCGDLLLYVRKARLCRATNWSCALFTL